MNVAIALGIRDDVEMIKVFIDYHLEKGIYKIFIIDFNSKDGTREVLRTYEEHPQIYVEYINEDIINNKHLQQRIRLKAYQDTNVDYLLHLDPDEFLILSRGKSLQDIISMNPADCYSIRRRNLVPGERLKSSFSSKWLSIAQKLFVFDRGGPQLSDDSVMSKYCLYSGISKEPLNSLLTWIVSTPLPKVMHRTVPLQLNMGFHNVSSPEVQNILCPANMAILHIPLSTYKRFHNKLSNIHDCLTLSPELYPKDSAYHWKQWHRLYLDNRSEELYEAAFLPPSELKQLSTANEIKQFRTILSKPNQRLSPRPLYVPEASYPLYRGELDVE